MASLNYPSCIPDLISVGCHPLPGLRTYGLRLTPAAAADAWSSLYRAEQLIKQQPSAREERWTFDDDGNIRCIPGFVLKHKPHKSHLTLTKKAAMDLSRSIVLPIELRRFFDEAAQLMSAVSDTLTDIAPPAPFSTLLNLRVFEYRNTEPGSCGMKGHIDGSRFTIVVAQSDGCLEVLNQDRQWMTVDREGDRPFAVLLPGRSFAYSGIMPTVHRVTPIVGCRYSTTIFESPDLGSSKRRAERTAANWKWTELQRLNQ